MCYSTQYTETHRTAVISLEECINNTVQCSQLVYALEANWHATNSFKLNTFSYFMYLYSCDCVI